MIHGGQVRDKTQGVVGFSNLSIPLQKEKNKKKKDKKERKEKKEKENGWRRRW